MPLYQVSDEWEHNGRDDSDWYVVVYDAEKDELKRVEVGTTRFAGCSEHGYQVCYKCRDIVPMTDEVLPRAKECLKRKWEGFIRASEKNRVETATGKIGEKVRVKEDINNRPRADVQCDKCNGSGKWINPRNDKDVRGCFACNGEGVKKGKATKGKMVVIPAETKGTIKAFFVNKSQYGTWTYSQTAVVRREDGTEFRAPLDKLRLDEEVSEERIQQLIARHENDAYSLFSTANFGLFGSRL